MDASYQVYIKATATVRQDNGQDSDVIRRIQMPEMNTISTKKYSMLKFKTHLITGVILLKFSIFVLFNIINRLQEIRKVDKLTVNGLKGQDVAYHCSKMVRQGGHVVNIMKSSLQYIQQIWTNARSSHAIGQFGSDFDIGSVRFSHVILRNTNDVDCCFFVE